MRKVFLISLTALSIIITANAKDINKTTTNSSRDFTLGKYGSFKFEKINANVYVMHGPVVVPNLENKGFMNNPAFIESKKG